MVQQTGDTCRCNVTSYFPKKFVILHILEGYIDLSPYGSSIFLLPHAFVRYRLPCVHMHCPRLQPITGPMLTEPHARRRDGPQPVS
jgi:hypothetical protein